MSNEQEIEEAIQLKGLNSPRLTPEGIAGVIETIDYHKLTGTLTVCVLTLKNGFTVTGESACVSAENYDQVIGEKVAFDNAKDKIWTLEGYLLKELLYINSLNGD